MNKKTIAVLFGGHSPEYEVSLKSAFAVMSNMNRERYEIIPVGITRDGRWMRYSGDYESIKNDTWHEKEEKCVPACISPDREVHGLVEFFGDVVSKVRIDMVFPVLHGSLGEDGTVQGLAELAGIPVIGCGTLSSALCMDKELADRIVESVGVETPWFITARKGEPVEKAVKAAEKLAYPLYVKPVRAGSSFGVSRIEEPGEMEKALEKAFEHDSRAIIEENVEGAEVGCSIIGNHRLILGRADEIELDNVLFDYNEKYTQKHTTIHMPARVDSETEKRILETAEKIYRALDCSGFARVDMFLTPEGRILFNEVNTIPGLTELSRYPRMLEGKGISFERMLELMVEAGEENEKEK